MCSARRRRELKDADRARVRYKQNAVSIKSETYWGIKAWAKLLFVPEGVNLKIVPVPRSAS